MKTEGGPTPLAKLRAPRLVDPAQNMSLMFQSAEENNEVVVEVSKDIYFSRA